MISALFPILRSAILAGTGRIQALQVILADWALHENTRPHPYNYLFL